MSRRKNDAYYTPDTLASHLVALTDAAWGLNGATVIEPSIGGGAFARALIDVGALVTGYDIDPAAAGLAVAPSTCADFLTVDAAAEYVIGNPPYSQAEEHVRHALETATVGVAMLLRLAFLESGKRVAFWAEHPAETVIVLQQRPSFTGGGTDSAAYGWFMWRHGHTDTRLRLTTWR